jgi:hypothetical protein
LTPNRVPTAEASASKPKFSFWGSMAELMRLVGRSKARGLKVRLTTALILVLVGKATGVIAPVLIGRAIDAVSHGVSNTSVVCSPPSQASPAAGCCCASSPASPR